MLNEVVNKDGHSMIEVLCMGSASDENLALAQNVLKSLMDTGNASSDPYIVQNIEGSAAVFTLGNKLVGIIPNEKVKLAALLKGKLAGFIQTVEEFKNDMITFKMTVFLDGISGTASEDVTPANQPTILTYNGKKYQRLFVKAHASGYNTTRTMHIASELREGKDPSDIIMGQVYATKERGKVILYGKNYDRKGLPLYDTIGNRDEDDFIQEIDDDTLSNELSQTDRINGFISNIYLDDYSNSKLEIEVLLNLDDYSEIPTIEGNEVFNPRNIPLEVASPFFYGRKGFFGVGLDNVPNYAWRFKGIDTSINGEKEEVYEINIHNKTTVENFFSKCELSVIGNRRTVLHFLPVYDRDSLSRDIPFVMVRDGVNNGELAYMDFLKEASDLYSVKYEKKWVKDECTFVCKKEDGKIEVFVYMDKVYEDRPDYDGCKTKEFKPDRKRWLSHFIPLLSSSVMVGNYFGFVAGTSESVKNDNMFMFEPTLTDEITTEDTAARYALIEGGELSLVKDPKDPDDSKVYVMSKDKRNKFGIVPTMMDIPVAMLVKNDFIRSVTVLSNKDNLRVLVKFGE